MKRIQNVCCLFIICAMVISLATPIAVKANEDSIVTAKFYLVKEGGSRTNYSTSNYTKVGTGSLINPVKILNDSTTIEEHFYSVPDVSSYINVNNQYIEWYSMKHENDGWHIDGEIHTYERFESEAPDEEEPIVVQPIVFVTEPVVTEPNVIVTEPVVTEPAEKLEKAVFFVVKEGGSRKNYAASNYKKLGTGIVKNPIRIYEDSKSIEDSFIECPSTATLGLNDNQYIQWYSLKKEKDGWHVDGEIITVGTVSTPTPSPKPTATPTPSPKPTATPTPSPKPTATPTPSPKLTVTPTPTLTPMDKKTLRTMLYKMLVTGDPEPFDISSMNLTYAELNTVWENMISNEGHIAHESSSTAILQITRKANSRVETVWIMDLDKVTGDAFVSRYNEVQSAISEVKLATQNMNSLEKVLYVNEYVISNTIYRRGKMSAFTAGGSLGEGVAICEGYAKASILLLEQIGIRAEYVSSVSMNHGWVYVELDGEWYHFDPTWDDTGKGINENNYLHINFLRNDIEYTKKMKYGHYNWRLNTSVKDTVISTSSKYENWFVHDIRGRIIYQDGIWYYVDPMNGNIVGSKLDKSNYRVILEKNSYDMQLLESNQGYINYLENGVVKSISIK